MKNIFYRKILVSVVVVLLAAGTIIPFVNAKQMKYFDNEKINKFHCIDNKTATIQFGGNSPGKEGYKIEIPFSKAKKIENDLRDLLNDVDSNKISSSKFIENMLTILRNENIIPSDYTYENFKNFAQRLYNEVYNNPKLLRLFSDKSSNIQSLISSDSIKPIVNSNPELQMGLITFKGSVAFGGPYGWAIRITPFEAIQEVISEPEFDFFDIFNGSAKMYWSLSPNVLLFLPGSPLGGHALTSLLPLPGYDSFQNAVWGGKTLIGIGVGLFGISMVVYMDGEISPQVIFEAAIQFTLGGFFMAYAPQPSLLKMMVRRNC